MHAVTAALAEAYSAALPSWLLAAPLTLLRLSHCPYMLPALPFSPTQVHAEQAPVIKKVGLKLVKKRKTPPEELARQVADQVLRSSMLRCAKGDK